MDRTQPFHLWFVELNIERLLVKCDLHNKKGRDTPILGYPALVNHGYVE